MRHTRLVPGVPTIKKIGIIAKHNIKESAEYLKTLVAALKKYSDDILFDEYTAAVMGAKTSYEKTAILSKAQLVIVLGGDGTLLKTARSLSKKKLMIAGVNMGNLGFLTAFTTQSIIKSLPKIFAGEVCPDERILLRVTVYRNGKKWHTNLALNDAVINQGGFARLIRLRVEVNQRELANYQADGLIISTPTGSTGHSLSAGGPIIHPKIEGFVLTPLCPIKLGMRPIIIPNNRQITIKLETEWRGGKKPIVLTLDGQVTINLKLGDIVRVRTSSRTMNLIRMGGHNYYKMLRKKLNWGA